MAGSYNLKTFHMTGINVHDNSSRIYEEVNRIWKNDTLTPLLKIENLNQNTGEADITYYECKDDGRFVNFGGMYINTESLYAILGYNANSEYYIPLFSVVELFNNIFFGTAKNTTIGKEDVLYIIESFKLRYKSFALTDFVKSLVQSNKSYGPSIILNFLKSKDTTPKTLKGNALDYLTDKDSYKVILQFFVRVNSLVDNFGKELFGNFISEEEGEMVRQNYNSKSVKSLMSYGVSGYESLYLKNIKERGVDADFAREASSIGFARTRRNEVKDTGDPEKTLALLSSGAYIDEWNGVKLENISEEKILTYNIFDLIRCVNREHDMSFSYDVLASLNTDVLYKNLISNLQLDLEIANIGQDKFLKNFRDYAKSIPLLLDAGALYGAKVKLTQKDFATFGSKELIGAGKIAEKIFSRVLKKF